MAKLAATSETRKLVDSLKNMKRGDFASPVFIASSHELKVVSTHIEDLRKTLLLLSDEAGKAEGRYYRALSDVVHDLKSPLQVILGYAECLSDGLDDRDYVKLISEKCLEMNDIVLNIISEAKKKVQGGKFEVVAVKDFFPDAVLKGAAPVIDKGIRLKVSNSPNVNVYVDVGAFRSVIQNLLSNAAKFTDKGGRVKVIAKAGKKYLKIRVSDNGQPIDPDKLEKIFERYYTTDKKSGSGVGLSSVKQIVAAHHGFVYALKRRRGAAIELMIPRYDKNKEEVSLAVRERRLHSFMMLGYIFLPFGMIYSFIRILVTSAQISKEKHIEHLSDPDEVLKRELKRLRSEEKKHE